MTNNELRFWFPEGVTVKSFKWTSIGHCSHISERQRHGEILNLKSNTNPISNQEGKYNNFTCESLVIYEEETECNGTETSHFQQQQCQCPATNEQDQSHGEQQENDTKRLTQIPVGFPRAADLVFPASGHEHDGHRSADKQDEQTVEGQ